MSRLLPNGVLQPIAMTNGSLRSLVRNHLEAGDTAVLHAQRTAMMSQNLKRAASVRRLAESIHHDLGSMTLENAKSDSFKSGAPSMSVRHIGNKLYGTARGLHCHAGIYRTRGAHELLTRGGLTLDGNALVHFEHTIPSNLLVDLMWRLHSANAFPDPADLLAWLLRHSVVTIALQSERKAKGDEPVALGRLRTLDGVRCQWSRSHPDLLDNMPMSDAVRPFRRYSGAGVEVIHWPTELTVDLADETMATHAARISTCPLHNVSTYF